MAEVNIVDTPPPSPPPTPTTTLNAATIPAPASPAPPPKPGSARERMFKDLRARATDPNAPAAAPTPKAPAATDPNPDPNPTTDPTPDPSPDPAATTDPAATPTDPKAKKEKANPWKLYESSKAKIAALEQELNGLKEKFVPENDRETFTKRLTETEARAKALEDEIRFVNYEKSEEFKSKYQAPYEGAWKRAMAELSEISLVDPASKEQRAVTSQDLLNLVNLPLGQARELADALYGPFADDVMTHRKEIRNLFETRNAALAEAKEKGAEREKQRQEQFQTFNKQTTEAVRKTWETANQAAAKDEKYGKYFVPVEGDEEGNQRLGKGFQLVDRAFSDPSPTDPRLTAEQRSDIVRRHAAVRNRAAAFGRLVLQNTKLAEQVTALQKKLDGYKESTPSPTTETRPPVANGGGSARDRMFGALRQIAK